MGILLGAAEEVDVQLVEELLGEHHRDHDPEVRRPVLGPDRLELIEHLDNLSRFGFGDGHGLDPMQAPLDQRQVLCRPTLHHPAGLDLQGRLGALAHLTGLYLIGRDRRDHGVEVVVVLHLHTGTEDRDMQLPHRLREAALE